MPNEVVLSPRARLEFRALSAYARAKVRDATDRHLIHTPTEEGKSRVKRLRGMRKPQYRLAMDDLRVYYDVEGVSVLVHGIGDKACADAWLSEEGGTGMEQVPFAEVRDHLSRCLVEACEEPIVITKHGTPAGVLTGFATDDDWFDFRVENDPRFWKKTEESRASLRAGHGVSWDDVKEEGDERTRADRGPTHRRAGGYVGP